MRILIASATLCIVSFLSPSVSPAQTVLATNYDVVLTVGDAQYRAQSRVQVAAGDTIPVEFDRFRVDLEISSYDAENFKVLITLYERISGEWIQLDVDPGGFGGAFGAPHSFSWNGDSMRLNIAIIVSFYDEQHRDR